MKIHQVEQQGEDWFKLRELKLTSSKATAIGNNGKGLETLVTTLVAEHLSSGDRKHFNNIHTDRGNELEETARQIYELETGNKVETVGFIEINEHVGCSPDGLIGADGLTEFKCPDDVKFYKILMNGEKEIDSDYLWQTQYQLLTTQRKFADLCFYNPNYTKSLAIFRILPDPEKQEALKKGIEIGTRLIKEQLEKFRALPSETSPIIIGEEPKEEIVKVFEGTKAVGAISIPKTIKKK